MMGCVIGWLEFKLEVSTFCELHANNTGHNLDQQPLFSPTSSLWLPVPLQFNDPAASSEVARGGRDEMITGSRQSGGTTRSDLLVVSQLVAGGNQLLKMII